ncbi:hypothetical protein BGZ76_008457 [Entomortierella beljakovae]|nr:hypothetical protein BGZ76_008457 [Entomortierella beljakovae]
MTRSEHEKLLLLKERVDELEIVLKEYYVSADIFDRFAKARQDKTLSRKNTADRMNEPKEKILPDDGGVGVGVGGHGGAIGGGKDDDEFGVLIHTHDMLLSDIPDHVEAAPPRGGSRAEPPLGVVTRTAPCISSISNHSNANNSKFSS